MIYMTDTKEGKDIDSGAALITPVPVKEISRFLIFCSGIFLFIGICGCSGAVTLREGTLVIGDILLGSLSLERI